MAGHMDFEFDLRGSSRKAPDAGRPFNLLVIGDFSAAGRTPSANLSYRRILPVDLDSLDALWTRFEPRQILEVGPATVEFQPRDMDDFHPDRLFRNLPVFAECSALLGRLQDPATATETLTELLSGSSSGRAPAPESTDVPQGEPAADDGLFERLLGKRTESPGGGPRPPAAAGLDRLIRDLVAPHIVSSPDPRVDAAVESVERTTAEIMRHILHHPGFQELEASWRSLTDLVSELELDDSLQLFVCDIKREELLNGLPEPGSSLQECPLFELLVERRKQAADDSPWSVIVGDFYFDDSDESMALLTALGAAAAASGAVFAGGAAPRLLGCRTIEELADVRDGTGARPEPPSWQALRASPVAPHIGLALPRVLGRLPYGKDTEPVDAFGFEEMPDRRHAHYLWLNPAWTCGRLLAQAFTEAGWSMQPGDHVALGSLPAHHFVEDGEPRLQPCTERLLSEAAMVAILKRGVMPLISYRNQNTAVLGRFQSIAHPEKSLQGPWL